MRGSTVRGIAILWRCIHDNGMYFCTPTTDPFEDLARTLQAAFASRPAADAAPSVVKTIGGPALVVQAPDSARLLPLAA